MIRCLTILEDGFEDTEAICTIDILKRSGINVTTVSFNNKELITQSNHKFITDSLYSDINLDCFDFLFIPGGKAVFNSLISNSEVSNIINYFNKSNKYICLICAAPMLAGKIGLLENKKYTCFKGCNENIKGIYTNKGVEVSSNFITGKSMAYSVDFGLEIIRQIQGKEQYKIIKKQIFSE